MYHQDESSYGHRGDCGCQHHSHHGMKEQLHHRWDCGCGHHGMRGHRLHHGCCHPGYGYRRHFLTREEVMAQLEEYLSNLQAEVKGVEEHMAELRKNET